MKEIVINFNDYPDMDAFHDDIAKKLDFPAYYGRNLDALNDLISESVDDWHFTILYGGAIPREKQNVIAEILTQNM